MGTIEVISKSRSEICDIKGEARLVEAHYQTRFYKPPTHPTAVEGMGRRFSGHYFLYFYWG
jgi:hypothetical protein